MSVLDTQTYKQDFPILQQQVHNKPLVYLDNAATTQLPKSVIKAMTDYMVSDNANTHGRIHALSERSQKHVDLARESVANFICADANEVIFVPGATYGLNLVANAYFKNILQPNDIIVLTYMEHHSNIIPWQNLAKATGAKLVFIDVDDNGNLDQTQYQRVLEQKPKCLSITHVSNVLGVCNPLKSMIELAHDAGCKVVVDGAQAAGHIELDVKDLGCDFYVFSGHKMYAPTGVGVVYAKADLMQSMVPFIVGGGIVSTVTTTDVQYLSPPHCFEPGTKNVISIVGLRAAIEYVQTIGIKKMHQHEQSLATLLYSGLKDIKNMRILGGESRSALVSFVIEGAHPHDLVMLLDQYGVAVRGGHHCAMPLLSRYGVNAATRVSTSIYNTKKDIEVFFDSLNQTLRVLRVG